MSNKPNKKILRIWELYLLLLACVPAIISILLLRWSVPYGIGWIFTALWGAVYLYISIFYLPAFYRSLRCCVEGERLFVESGVFVHQKRCVPFSRIVYVSTVYEPLSKRCGLVMLIIFTAGSFIMVHGISAADAERLKLQICGERKGDAAP